jgi:DNA processing protein
MLGIGVEGPVAPALGPGREPCVHDGTSTARAISEVEREAWAVLASIDGLGPVAFTALLARYGTARAIVEEAGRSGAATRLAATPGIDRARPLRRRAPVSRPLATALVEAAQRAPAVAGRLRDLGVRVVTIRDQAYPPRLGRIEMPPHVLFVQGDPAAMDGRRAVAVVGTRRPTTSGRTTARRIVTALVAADAVVVSGLAYGIDGAAHEAAIRAGGLTVAVIGGGHAVGVPSGHDRLARAIVESGGAIVSEFAPDTEPTRGTFPRRNRVISGLADATVVVEAPARSGALLTASWALEQGRECFLVPGAIDAPASAGCLAFLREWWPAARMVAGIPHLIADLGYAGATGTPEPAPAVARAALQELGATPTLIAGAMLRGHATVDELTAVTDLPVGAVLAALALLEGRGLVVGIHGRYRPAAVLLDGTAPSEGAT